MYRTGVVLCFFSVLLINQGRAASPGMGLDAAVAMLSFFSVVVADRGAELQPQVGCPPKCVCSPYGPMGTAQYTVSCEEFPTTALPQGVIVFQV